MAALGVQLAAGGVAGRRSVDQTGNLIKDGGRLQEGGRLLGGRLPGGLQLSGRPPGSRPAAPDIIIFYK